MSTSSPFVSALRRSSAALALIVCGLTVGACDSADEYALRVAEVEEVQERGDEFHRDHDQCLDGFVDCFAAEPDAYDACREQLRACAPESVEYTPHDERGGERGDRPEGERGDKKRRPHCGPKGERPDGERPDGDRPEDIPEDRPELDGERPDGERPDHRRRCGPGHHLAKEAIKGCRDDMKACMDGDGDPKGCLGEMRSCVAEAIKGAFDKLCEAHIERCDDPDAPADLCAEISARCEEGVPPPPFELPELPPAPDND